VTKRLIDRDELWTLFVMHYWDSFQKDRDLILSHINDVMMMVKDETPAPRRSTVPRPAPRNAMPRAR
jgi:hypothetical protein